MGVFFGGGSASSFSIISRDYTANVVSLQFGGTIVSYTVPANTLGAQGILHLNSVWAYTCVVGGFLESFDMQFNFGGTTMVFKRFSNPNSSSSGFFQVDWFIAALNSTSSQASYGQVNTGVFESSGAGAILTSPLAASGGVTFQFTKDMTSAQLMNIQLQPIGIGTVTTTMTHLLTEVTRTQ